MTNVLILYTEEGPTMLEFERCLRGLEQKGFFILKRASIETLTKHLFEWADILCGIRSTESIECDIFKYARNRGIYVIELLDDDFLSLDSGYGSEGEGFWWGRKCILKSVMKNIDCLIAPNQNIVNKYGAIGNITGSPRNSGENRKK